VVISMAVTLVTLLLNLVTEKERLNIILSG